MKPIASNALYLGLVIIGICLFETYIETLAWFSFSTLLYFTLIGIGVGKLDWAFFIPVQSLNRDNSCALTFDDGPDPRNTPIILEILKKHGVKATFFVIGKKAAEAPDLVRKIVADGHQVGNHTFSHSYSISLWFPDWINDDIEKCQQLVRDITGATPRYFRPPVGITSPLYHFPIWKSKLRVVGWSLRSYDTLAKNRENLIQKLLSKIDKGDIVLLHDDRAITASILDEFIEKTKAKGLTFQPLSC